MSALAGRYITDTDDFLAVTDEKSLIQAADDPKGPETALESFVELEAAAPGSDDEEVLDAIIAVINSEIALTEPIIESFGGGRYVIPYAPVDGTIKSLAVEWAWIGLQKRRGTLSVDEAERQRDSIRSIGDRIADGRYALVSAKLVDSEAAGEEFFAYGGAERRFTQEGFDGIGGNYRVGR